MSTFICEYCLESFTTKQLLTKHIKTAKYCILYQNVFFVCKKCKFSTPGIKNIEKHIEENKCINTIIDINEYSIDENSIDNFDNIHEPKSENIISKMENALKFEKIKNNIYKTIIEQNIPIKLDNIMMEDETGLHIYENNLNNIGIHIHANEKKDLSILTTGMEFLTNVIKPFSPSNSIEEIDENDKQAKSFKSYKNLKNSVKEPTKEDIETRVRDMDMQIYNTRRNFTSVAQTKTIFKETFDNIRATRICLKGLETLKKIRLSLIGSILLPEYISILKDHINTLEIIYKDKGHNNKKIIGTIMKSLNSIDARLILYGHYYDIPMDMDEFSKFKICLDLSAKFSSYYTPFDFQESIKLFYNYGTVLLSIKHCVEKYLINRYGFHNIVYIQTKQSTEEDPYSFYILENITKDKRYWKMDCRLVELSEQIINNVRPFLINLFRKIYQDIFNDNDYRENYSIKTEITGNDFEQLIQNIFILSDSFRFYNIMRKIIKDNSTYQSTENDRVNIFGDDLILKKRFSKNVVNVDKVDIVKLLFDNITNEQAVDLYRSKNIY